MTEGETQDRAGIWGGCACGALRYRLLDAPMFVNCCHCTWCQRESGSAFAVNAVIETNRIAVEGAVESAHLPTASGKGQELRRCMACKGVVYSHFAGAGPAIAFLKVGTLDQPALCPPQAHIYTATKQPWVVLAPGVPVFEQYYRMKEVWPAEALARRAKVTAGSAPR